MTDLSAIENPTTEELQHWPWIAATQPLILVHRLSLLSQNKIQCPASSHMLAWLTEMAEDLNAVAANFFKSVSKDSETIRFKCPGGQGAVVVGGLGQGEDG